MHTQQGLFLKWLAFIAMRNREKRRDGPENLIKEYEIQNSCSKARYQLGNIGSNMIFIFLSSLFKLVNILFNRL